MRKSTLWFQQLLHASISPCSIFTGSQDFLTSRHARDTCPSLVKQSGTPFDGPLEFLSITYYCIILVPMRHLLNVSSAVLPGNVACVAKFETRVSIMVVPEACLFKDNQILPQLKLSSHHILFNAPVGLPEAFSYKYLPEPLFPLIIAFVFKNLIFPNP
jgi:hypothetical protein